MLDQYQMQKKHEKKSAKRREVMRHKKWLISTFGHYEGSIKYDDWRSQVRERQKKWRGANGDNISQG